jgi:hypothetical protein
MVSRGWNGFTEPGKLRRECVCSGEWRGLQNRCGGVQARSQVGSTPMHSRQLLRVPHIHPLPVVSLPSDRVGSVEWARDPKEHDHRDQLHAHALLNSSHLVLSPSFHLYRFSVR